MYFCNLSPTIPERRTKNLCKNTTIKRRFLIFIKVKNTKQLRFSFIYIGGFISCSSICISEQQETPPYTDDRIYKNNSG